jgi:OOP family OmpA-OmpF porin
MGLLCALMGALLAVSAPAAPPPQAAQQPNLTAVKADFIPGDKTIFYDDFTDMEGDEPPPHWRVRGGSFELRVAKDVRQLTTTSGGTMTANLNGLPKNFTVEAVIKFDEPGDSRSIWTLMTKDDTEALKLYTQTQGENLFVRLYVGDEDLGYKTIPIDWNQPIQLGWWLQNGRLRAYVNGERLIDVNQITLPAVSRLEVLSQIYGDGKGVGYRMVRIAESTPDIGKSIMASGRYVSHGILFDTDSDRIKSESAPAIKAIARALETEPALKLLIEGHTDSTGNADHNLDLSKRRAEAVKAVLVSQFNVDAGRLTTAGLGATKPIDTNDTPSGRAQNRRVEFVKQ